MCWPCGPRDNYDTQACSACSAPGLRARCTSCASKCSECQMTLRVLCARWQCQLRPPGRLAAGRQLHEPEQLHAPEHLQHLGPHNQEQHVAGWLVIRDGRALGTVPPAAAGRGLARCSRDRLLGRLQILCPAPTEAAHRCECQVGPLPTFPFFQPSSWRRGSRHAQQPWASQAGRAGVHALFPHASLHMPPHPSPAHAATAGPTRGTHPRCTHHAHMSQNTTARVRSSR